MTLLPPGPTIYELPGAEEKGGEAGRLCRGLAAAQIQVPRLLPTRTLVCAGKAMRQLPPEKQNRTCCSSFKSPGSTHPKLPARFRHLSTQQPATPSDPIFLPRKKPLSTLPYQNSWLHNPFPTRLPPSPALSSPQP